MGAGAAILATRLAGAALSWAAFGVLAAGAIGCAAGGCWARRFGSARVAGCAAGDQRRCAAWLAPWLLDAPDALFAAWLLLWGITVSGDSPQFSALTAQQRAAAGRGQRADAGQQHRLCHLHRQHPAVRAAGRAPLASLLPWLAARAGARLVGAAAAVAMSDTPGSRASVRTLLPLALLTGTSMLAMDLFLPAVPTLQAHLNVGVTPHKPPIAIYLAGLAASQLLWGELLNRLGPRGCVWWSVSLLALASAGCALAPTIEVLLGMRLLQGIAAGAATVVAASVIRATLGDADAVRGMATIASIEAIVPAAGPVLGTLLLVSTDWRSTFWIVALATLAVLPFVVRVAPRQLPGLASTCRRATATSWATAASRGWRCRTRWRSVRCSRSSAARLNCCSTR